MNYRQYQALNIRRKTSGEDPLPTIVEVIDIVMEPNKIIKREDIIREVSAMTKIDIDSDLSAIVSTTLADLEKALKVSRVATGLWQKRD